MQAYATAHAVPSSPLRVVPSTTSPVADLAAASPRNVILEELLGQLAELVADRVADRLVPSRGETSDEWLDTRKAAEYLGLHRDTLRRLAAERAIPTEQAGAGCKLYFRRSDLDDWRCSSAGPIQAARLAGRRND